MTGVSYPWGGDASRSIASVPPRDACGPRHDGHPLSVGRVPPSLNRERPAPRRGSISLRRASLASGALTSRTQSRASSTQTGVHLVDAGFSLRGTHPSYRQEGLVIAMGRMRFPLNRPRLGPGGTRMSRARASLGEGDSPFPLNGCPLERRGTRLTFIRASLVHKRLAHPAQSGPSWRKTVASCAQSRPAWLQKVVSCAQSHAHSAHDAAP
jgi:hypothetical protein